MLESPHAIVGAAIATKIPNPYISLPLAFASHFVLDRVPHWNPHLNTEVSKYGKVTTVSKAIVIADVVLALIAGFWMASLLPSQSQSTLVVMGAFAGVLPDVVEGPYFFLNIKTKAIRQWIKFQKSIQVDTSLIPGVLTQLITVIAAIFWAVS
jgi:hypothetical protein